MHVVEFEELVSLCEEMGGLSISMPGEGDYDEVRVMCVRELPELDEFRANYIRHRVSGGFVYGGQAGCVFGRDAYEALAAVLSSAIGFDCTAESELNAFGVRSLYDPSRAELVYGSEAWNNYEYGTDLL